MTAPLVADERVDVSDVAEIVGTRLAEVDRDIGAFLILIGLPSLMERNPVSTEVEPEHRVALIALIALFALRSRRLRRREGQAVVGDVRQQAAQDEEPPARRRPSSTRGGRGLAWVGCVDALDAQGSVIRGSWVVSLDQVRSLSSSAC
ncbi:hypothetical protein ACFVYV_40560 [Streptomyces mirabilis]|uniref:hypothetical protein n=1 Tax=Streptomyces mirabilis TaxID=68239 RepID=UPI0036DB8C1B